MRSLWFILAFLLFKMCTSLAVILLMCSRLCLPYCLRGEMMKVAYTLVFFVMLGANARLLWDLLIIQVRILIAVALLDTLCID